MGAQCYFLAMKAWTSYLLLTAKKSVIKVTFTKDEESYKIASLKDIISVNTKKKRKGNEDRTFTKS